MLAFIIASLVLPSLTTAQAHINPPNTTSLTNRSENPIIGCGIFVDDLGIGQATLSDKECRSLGRQADYVNLAGGCMCVAFREAGCSADKPVSWSYIGVGPRTNYDLKGTDAKWVQCTTDPKWAQNWFDRFVRYNYGPDATPYTVRTDGTRVLDRVVIPDHMFTSYR